LTEPKDQLKAKKPKDAEIDEKPGRKTPRSLAKRHPSLPPL